MDKTEMPLPIITVEGPTASGKSSYALELAKEIHSELISADSRQIYRFLNIGTAKPTPKQMKEVRHHLIDIVNPDEEYSAGRLVNDASSLIENLCKKKALSIVADKESARLRIPIIVGGTGFYIQALLEGLFDAPPVNEEIRKELDAFEQEKGSGYLHGILERLDADSAKKIHPNDSYRLKRALEVWIATGKSLSSHWTEQQKDTNKYTAFRILITEDRDILYRRINHRMENMVEMGLIEEIKDLLDKGYNPTDPGLTSVGYKEFIPFILGNSSFFTCLEEAKKNTRNYAKRQATWYRRIDFNFCTKREDAEISHAIELIRNYFEKRA